MERMRKWRCNGEKEMKWRGSKSLFISPLSPCLHSLSIFSFSLHLLFIFSFALPLNFLILLPFSRKRLPSFPQLVQACHQYFSHPSLTTAQCVHCTVFFPFDRERWDTFSNLETVMLSNIYLSQRSRSKGTLRKLDFCESQTLNL